jgi:hypothetical protein
LASDRDFEKVFFLKIACLCKAREQFMSKKHPECPLYNHNTCKDIDNEQICAIVKKDQVCLKKMKKPQKQFEAVSAQLPKKRTGI